MSFEWGFLSLARNRWAQVGVSIVASAGLAYLAARSLAWGEVAETFGDFSLWAILIALGPLAAAMLLRALRWHVLLHREPTSFTNVVITQNTGIGLNNLSPIRMLSEPVQLALITRRYDVPFPTAFATLVGGNVLDIFATALLLALGILLAPDLRDGRISIQIIGAFIMFCVSILVFIAVARGIGSIPLAGRVQFFRRVVLAIGLLRDQPGRLALSFAATFGHWLALGVTGWVLAKGLGVDVPPLTMATVLVAATFFASAVPSAPSGAGTYHFAVITMLTGLGIDPAAAFSFAVVMHLVFVLPSSIIALGMVGRVGLKVLLRPADADVPEEPSLQPVSSRVAEHLADA